MTSQASKVIRFAKFATDTDTLIRNELCVQCKRVRLCDRVNLFEDRFKHCRVVVSYDVDKVVGGRYCALEHFHIGVDAKRLVHGYCELSTRSVFARHVTAAGDFLVLENEGVAEWNAVELSEVNCFGRVPVDYVVTDVVHLLSWFKMLLCAC